MMVSTCEKQIEMVWETLTFWYTLNCILPELMSDIISPKFFSTNDGFISPNDFGFVETDRARTLESSQLISVHAILC